MTAPFRKCVRSPPAMPLCVISPSLATMSILTPIRGATKRIINVKITVPRNPPTPAFQIFGFTFSPPVAFLLLHYSHSVTIRIPDDHSRVEPHLRLGQPCDPR